MRSPLGTLYTGDYDTRADEAAVTMQLLYMHGMLEPSEFGDFYSHLGQKPREGDLSRNCMREVLTAGFSVRIIHEYNLHRILGSDGDSYLAEGWRNEGLSEKVIRRDLPLTIQAIRQRAKADLKLEKQFGTRYTHIERKATHEDVAAMIAKGQQVECELLTDSGMVDGVLVTAEKGKSYVVYDPRRGVSSEKKTAFNARRLATVTGYHLF
jgi:hypothetical protein